MMKLIPLIFIYMTFALCSDAFSLEPVVDDPKRTCSDKAVSEKSSEKAGQLKVFIDPETGKFLTYKQWKSLGIEEQEVLQKPHTPKLTAKDDSERISEVSKVLLPDGTYAFTVEAPESARSHTKVEFDENGKPHITCH